MRTNRRTELRVTRERLEHGQQRLCRSETGKRDECTVQRRLKARVATVLMPVRHAPVRPHERDDRSDVAEHEKRKCIFKDLFEAHLIADQAFCRRASRTFEAMFSSLRSRSKRPRKSASKTLKSSESMSDFDAAMTPASAR